MANILNIEPDNYCNEARSILTSIGTLTENKMTRDSIKKCLGEYDVLIVRLNNQIDRDIINHGKSLKAIVTATTGLDHIDVEYANQQGIAVLSLRDEREFLKTIPATAEHTWALLLSLIRNIPKAFQSVCQNQWSRDSFRGTELSNKQLGIVGLGRVGEMVARYGNAFGMDVNGWDPYRRDWLPDVNRCQSFEELLVLSNILSIHVPLTEDNRLLIGSRELSILPDDAIVLNTSRGELIDHSALLDYLEKGKLGGAALDVLPCERDFETLERKALIQYASTKSNLIITPHIAGATVESMANTEIFMAHKLKAWIIENHS